MSVSSVMPHKIVLAHGFLGFGNPRDDHRFANYFNGVAERLTAQGHTVHRPRVNPFGSIVERGRTLAETILQIGTPLHIIAHSMGGLDARHAIAHELPPGHIKTLVTIGTPHRGSPVADGLTSPINPVDLLPLPVGLRHALDENTGALRNLTTSFAQHFDDTTHDKDDIRYIEIAGDVSQTHGHPIFRLATLIGDIHGKNDGLVTTESALREIPNHEHLIWPVDHAGEVGWTFDSLTSHEPLAPPADHLDRYDRLVAMLR